MKKTLLISEQFPPLIGGAAVYFYNLYSRLSPEETAVYTNKRKGGREFDQKQKIKIYRGWIWKTPFSLFHPNSIIGPFWLFFSVIRYIFKEKIDILNCGSVHPFGECGLLIKKLLGLPYIVYAFGEEIGYFKINRFKKLIITSVLKNADVIVVLSDNTKNILINMGIDKDKITKIPGGVDLDKFKVTEETISKKEKFGLQDKKVLLTIARLEERKGHDVVIRALPKVLERFRDTVYVIVGGGSNEKRLKELTRQLKIEDKVIFWGEVPFDQVKNYYPLCDIFIMVNRAIPEKGDIEGFGLVFLEANASGKPVIGGKSGGATDAIEDGITGILINNPLDENEVRGAIIRLLENEEGAKKMGQAGRKRVEAFFNWEQQVERLIQINKKVLVN